MTKASRFEPLADQADRELKRAARELAKVLNELRVAETQLAKLTEYLDDYHQRLCAPQSGVSSERWQNDRRFMERLSEVISTQQKAVDKLRRTHRQQLDAWRESHLKNKAMQDLLETYCRAELQALERAEQDEADESILAKLERG
ncbi:MAG: flagellar export protein FliJ [Gammaproteobacteria bacterium]|nr:flagellar export protein FliJ [Gammaproteobacteria bacterium]